MTSLLFTILAMLGAMFTIVAILPTVADFAFPFLTNALEYEGTELCSILQAAIREDDPTNIAFAVIFARAININRVNRDKKIPLFAPYPPTLKADDVAIAGSGCASWRGGGFRDEYKEFFTVSKKYRVPGFLATSLKKTTATNFIRMAHKKSDRFPRILWCIKVCVRACLFVQMVL